MPKPYSEDLREKVLKVYDSKELSIKKICKMFNLDVKTLYYWRKRRKQTGSIKSTTGYQKGYSHKIKDNEFYAYGWAPKGQRLFSEKPAFKNKRISIIGALNDGKVGAACAFEGYCNSALFEAYIKNILVPVLQPGQTIILDNASFHKSVRN